MSRGTVDRRLRETGEQAEIHAQTATALLDRHAVGQIARLVMHGGKFGLQKDEVAHRRFRRCSASASRCNTSSKAGGSFRNIGSIFM